MSKKNKNRLVHCGFLSVSDSEHELEMWSNATSPTLKTIDEYDDFEERDSTCDVTADEDSLDSIINCFGGCKSLKPSAFEQVLPEIALDEESSDSSSSDYDTITRCFGGEKNFSSLSYSEMFSDTEDELVETYDDTFSREMLLQLMQPSKPSVCRSTERTVVASLELDNNTQGNSNPKDSKQKQPRFHSYAEAEDFAARYLIENFSAGLCHGTPYIRVGDVFRLISSTSVGTLITSSAPQYVRTMISANNFKHVANRVVLTLANKQIKLQVPKRTVLFLNGAWDVITQSPVHPRENEIFLGKIQAVYVPGDSLETPVFDDFLETVSQGDLEIQQRILEFLGYMLIPGVPAKSFFVLGTASNSGKSIFGTFLNELLGEELVCAMSTTDFTNDFKVVQLTEHVASISMDSNRKPLDDETAARIKKITGFDKITVHQKGCPTMPFRNLAKIVFATNHAIRLNYRDSAFFERMIVVPFMYSVPHQDRDPDLLEKLLNEKNGIVQKAMIALQQLLLNNYHFSPCKVADDTLADWSGIAEDSLHKFIAEACILDDEEIFPSRLLFNYYENFCRRYRFRHTVAENRFVSLLKDCHGLNSKRTIFEGKQRRCLIGITVAPQYRYESLDF